MKVYNMLFLMVKILWKSILKWLHNKFLKKCGFHMIFQIRPSNPPKKNPELFSSLFLFKISFFLTIFLKNYDILLHIFGKWWCPVVKISILSLCVNISEFFTHCIGATPSQVPVTTSTNYGPTSTVWRLCKGNCVSTKEKVKKKSKKKISLKIYTKQGVNLKIRWGNGRPEGLDWVTRHCSLKSNNENIRIQAMFLNNTVNSDCDHRH